MRKSIITIIFVTLTFCLSLISLPSNPVFASETNDEVYCVKDFNFEIQLPDTTTITEDYFDSNEIQFSAFFNDQTTGFWGYIQFWNIPELEEFLINSKANSTFSFYSYDLTPIKFMSYNGFQANWSAKLSNGHNISAQEYFFSQGEKVCMISFFSAGKIISTKLQKIIDFSLSSIDWNTD